MTTEERVNLRKHFNQQFEDVLIQERSDLYLILELIDRLDAAER